MEKEKIKILYEDDDILALDKPAGLSVHGDGVGEEYTVADWLAENYPALVGVGEPMVAQNGKEILRPGIVHRLDKDTSGVLLVAKNQKAFVWLKEQFQTGQVKKTYELLVGGKFKEVGFEGTIDIPIGRSTKDPRRRVAALKAEGKLREAVTNYKVLAVLDEYTYIEAYPKTGRTHQIRVHFKAMNHPLVGDALYGGPSGETLGMTRTALHAAQIEFTLPSGREMKLESPLPVDFETALEKLKSLC